MMQVRIVCPHHIGAHNFLLLILPLQIKDMKTFDEEYRPTYTRNKDAHNNTIPHIQKFVLIFCRIYSVCSSFIYTTRWHDRCVFSVLNIHSRHKIRPFQKFYMRHVARNKINIPICVKTIDT